MLPDNFWLEVLMGAPVIRACMRQLVQHALDETAETSTDMKRTISKLC